MASNKEVEVELQEIATAEEEKENKDEEKQETTGKMIIQKCFYISS